MGGDGGSIPGRVDLVTTKKAKTKLDESLLLRAKWTTCAITSEPLKSPIVYCALGNIYNKQNVITHHLLATEKTNTHTFQHIASINHVFDLNPQFKTSTESLTAGNEGQRFFICPVAGIIADGTRRFVAMKGCGCVISEKGIKEVPSTTCVGCGATLPSGQLCSPADYVVLNPEMEEQDAMRAALFEERKASKLKKQREKEAAKADKKKAKLQDALKAIAGGDDDDEKVSEVDGKESKGTKRKCKNDLKNDAKRQLDELKAKQAKAELEKKRAAEALR